MRLYLSRIRIPFCLPAPLTPTPVRWYRPAAWSGGTEVRSAVFVVFCALLAVHFPGRSCIYDVRVDGPLLPEGATRVALNGLLQVRSSQSSPARAARRVAPSLGRRGMDPCIVGVEDSRSSVRWVDVRQSDEAVAVDSVIPNVRKKVVGKVVLALFASSELLFRLYSQREESGSLTGKSGGPGGSPRAQGPSRGPRQPCDRLGPWR